VLLNSHDFLPHSQARATGGLYEDIHFIGRFVKRIRRTGKVRESANADSTPRSPMAFDQTARQQPGGASVLDALAAFMTVCMIKRTDAVELK